MVEIVVISYIVGLISARTRAMCHRRPWQRDDAGGVDRHPGNALAQGCRLVHRRDDPRLPHRR